MGKEVCVERFGSKAGIGFNMKNEIMVFAMASFNQ